MNSPFLPYHHVDFTFLLNICSCRRCSAIGCTHGSEIRALDSTLLLEGWARPPSTTGRPEVGECLQRLTRTFLRSKIILQPITLPTCAGLRRPFHESNQDATASVSHPASSALESGRERALENTLPPCPTWSFPGGSC